MYGLKRQLSKYTLSELIKIAVFKVGYKVSLKIKEVSIRLFPQRWSIVKCDGSKRNEADFREFYQHCDSDIDAIKHEADTIVSGNISIFGKLYTLIPENGWLTDPISQRVWDENAFFVSAPVKQRGLADVKYVLEVNKFNHLVRVALAYYYTHDDGYIKYLQKSVVGWRDTIKPYKSIVCRIMMDMGFRIINLIQIILLCRYSVYFNQNVEPLINGVIKDEVNAIMEFHTAKWFKTGNGLNHVTGEMIGVLVGQMWLEYCGVKKYTSAYHKEMKYLEEVLERTIAPSGAYLEQSDNYARVVVEFLVFFDICRNAMKPLNFPNSNYKAKRYTDRLLRFICSLNYHDQLPNVGDNDNARVLIAFRKGEDNVKYLESFCQEMDGNTEEYTDGSCWQYRSKDLNDVFMFTRVGRHSYVRESAGSHAHNDILSLILGIKGLMLFVDKGCRYYNAGDEIRKEDRQYCMHNTVSIDGVEINKLIPKGWYYNYPESHCIKSAREPNSCLFEGDLSYYGIKQKRKIEYKRNTITIEDSIEDEYDERTGKIRYLLHPSIIASQSDNSSIELKAKNGSLLAALTIKGINRLSIKHAAYSPYFAQERETLVIEGMFDYKNEKKIITTLTLE